MHRFLHSNDRLTARPSPRVVNVAFTEWHRTQTFAPAPQYCSTAARRELTVPVLITSVQGSTPRSTVHVVWWQHLRSFIGSPEVGVPTGTGSSDRRIQDKKRTPSPPATGSCGRVVAHQRSGGPASRPSRSITGDRPEPPGAETSCGS